ncbi:FecR family protein [Sphingobacterium suaedae]|uniref:FecR family protein n=1 Tax=Sphingobacterium suaedae TaxID=1686402 RepID=A0ABW5KDI9_9SPHI
MAPHRLWVLIGKKLSGEITALELDELTQLLNNDFAEFPLQELEDMWKQPVSSGERADHNVAAERSWRRLEGTLDKDQDDSKQPDRRVVSWFKRPFWLSSAAVVLVLAGILFHADLFDLTPPKNNQITAPDRGTSKVILPDGTSVWLNAKSHLTYKSDFGKKIREVKLQGEAYFDVAEDAQHPFIVRTSTINLKVLGTAFNVRSYPDERVTEAALVRGKVRISLLDNEDKEIVLKPSEKLTVNNAIVRDGKKSAGLNDPPLMTVTYVQKAPQDSLPYEALWLENTLAFNNENFEQIAKRMSAWYNVTMSIRNPNLKSVKMSGKFKDESVESALKALQLVADFDYQIEGRHIEIR